MVYLHEGKTAGIAGDLRRMLNEDFHYRLAMRLYSGTIWQSGTEEKVTVQKEAERPAIKLETVSSAQTVETPTEKPQPVEEKPEIEPRPKYSDGVQLSLLNLWATGCDRGEVVGTTSSASSVIMYWLIMYMDCPVPVSAARCKTTSTLTLLRQDQPHDIYILS